MSKENLLSVFFQDLFLSLKNNVEQFQKRDFMARFKGLQILTYKPDAFILKIDLYHVRRIYHS